MQHELRIRLRGEGEKQDMARRRRLKITRKKLQMMKELGRKVSEAEVIRGLIDGMV